MSLSPVPRPAPSRPLVAEFVNQVEQPRQIRVHAINTEAAEWFTRQCKEFGVIHGESHWANWGGSASDGCYTLYVKANYDTTQVVNYINAWRPTPTKDGLSSAWADTIETIDFNNTNPEDHHDQ